MTTSIRPELITCVPYNAPAAYVAGHDLQLDVIPILNTKLLHTEPLTRSLPCAVQPLTMTM
jgi:hypothetical protein